MQKRQIFHGIVLAIFLLALFLPVIKHKDYDISEGAKDKDVRSEIDKPVVEVPLHNVSLPEFSKIRDVKLKKKQFFAFLRPAILKENRRILTLRKSINEIAGKLANSQPLSAQESKTISDLVQR